MMFSRRDQIKFVLLCVFALTTIVGASLVYQQSHSLASISEIPDSQLGEDSEETSASWLVLENGDNFRSAFPASLHTPILNAIYKRHYELYGEIARSGQLDGSISSPDKDGYQTLTVVLGENNNRLTVRVKVISEATSNFDITIERPAR